MDGTRLKEYVDRFASASVLVVGDIIMDEYVWGDVRRISPEAPVPVVEVDRETKMLGGAANVVHNMATLGAKPILCGVVGGDRTGRNLLQMISRMSLSTEGIFTEGDRPTSIKTRVVANHQQVVRFDRETRRGILPETQGKILRFIEKHMDRLDAILVSDYGKGVISSPLMEGLRDLVKGSSTIIAVDPKLGNFKYYREVDVITPNHHEAGAFCGFEIFDDESLERSGKWILDHLNCRAVLITQGKKGMTLFQAIGEVTHIPTVARKVFDVTGAGDTVIGTLCLGLASGVDLKSAAIISNFAAGIVVGEVGTSAVRGEDLKKVINGRLI
jgi:D-glycero-beta-D-manno-heptose-7-phosphate kinase